MSQINLHVSAQTRFREVGDAVSPIASSGRRWAGPGLPPALHRQDGQVGPIHTNRLAQDRLVVLNGRQERRPLEWRDTGLDAANARDIIAFIHALGAEQVDIFGFSIGGMVAQQIVLDAPELLRQLILAGAGRSGGEGMAGFSRRILEIIIGRTARQPNGCWSCSSHRPRRARPRERHGLLASRHGTWIGNLPHRRRSPPPSWRR